MRASILSQMGAPAGRNRSSALYANDPRYPSSSLASQWAAALQVPINHCLLWEILPLM